jgi:hypothetical protein
MIKEKTFIGQYFIPENICDEIVNLCSGRNKLKFDPNQKDGPRGFFRGELAKLSLDCYYEYKKHLFSSLNAYLNEFSYLRFLDKLVLENDYVAVQLYDRGYFYSITHCENGHTLPTHHRILVFMTYCNTIENGGGTDFPYQNLQTKPKKGLTLIWPAYWTHPHTGIPSYDSRKVITTGWFTTELAGKLKEMGREAFPEEYYKQMSIKHSNSR